MDRRGRKDLLIIHHQMKKDASENPHESRKGKEHRMIEKSRIGEEGAKKTKNEDWFNRGEKMTSLSF